MFGVVRSTRRPIGYPRLSFRIWPALASRSCQSALHLCLQKVPGRGELVDWEGSLISLPCSFHDYKGQVKGQIKGKGLGARASLLSQEES